jgi:hypothetical protein
VSENAVFWDVAACRSCKNAVSEERLFTQDLHSATSKKTAFFIVTIVKTSNLN